MNRNPRQQLHRSRYQERDRKVVDYQEYDFDDRYRFRGPDPRPLNKSTIAFLGAAQTFGCFTDDPFPNQVARKLDRPLANFGWGGAGPRFFANAGPVLEAINSCGVAVVQVMSARSESNHLFDAQGSEFVSRRSDGQRIGAGDAWNEAIDGRPVAWMPEGRIIKGVRRRLLRPRAARLVEETRANWVESYRVLFERIEVPTVVLWFSTREPGYTDDFATARRLLNAFPQLVNEPMWRDISEMADEAAMVVSSRGLPQPLFHRETGEPVLVDPADDRPDLGGDLWTHNEYYPSPEMHVDAAASLVAPLQRLLVD